ncbi:TetR family transcriptional regulator C-terminal domain-containing protein [Octadecabacter sp. R77987]|uniref:TetR family transcriptional regulator C-terminal domain-containing protein n=1 Tax=Octadecabacter sp. R77987 TaxID=3093874 RepID=UPI00366BA24E
MTVKSSAQRPRKERKENADMRRTQLLEATRRSIVANGLARTTLATVANEAGLSQGVAVFYFKSKTGLLTETLRDQYQRYDQNWKKALADAADDPLEQVIAMIKADFSPDICNPDSLALWFAFWGEEKFTPQYAEISSEFDKAHRDVMHSLCTVLASKETGLDGDDVSDWIENVSDGYWQKLHLQPDTTTPQLATAATLRLFSRLLPSHATRIAQLSAL